MTEFFQCSKDPVSEGMKNRNVEETITDLDFRSQSSVITGISAEVVEFRFRHTTILNVELKKLMLEDMDDEEEDDDDEEDKIEKLYLDAEDVYYKLKEIGVVGLRSQKKLRFLSLSSTNMIDKAFGEITKSLVDSNESINFIENNGILDLSHNMISTCSIPELIRWIDKKKLRFINLYGNGNCSMSNIGDFCKSLKVAKVSNMEEVQRFMTHIIFLPDYYIYHASTQVKLYRQLHDLGYLPDSWAENQREYYRSISKKRVVFPEFVLEGDPDLHISFDE